MIVLQFPCHLSSHIPSSGVDIVCILLSYVQTMLWLPLLGILNVRTDFVMRAITHGGCTNIVRKSALKVDSGRKFPCRTERSNLYKPCLEMLIFVQTWKTYARAHTHTRARTHTHTHRGTHTVLYNKWTETLSCRPAKACVDSYQV